MASTVPATSSTTAAATSSTTAVVNLADDPLYVNCNENVAVSLVTQPLVGDKNYLNWRKSMEMALGIKMKLGFARGEFPRPVDPYQGARWDKCNNVVLSWIINSVSPEIGSSLIHSSDCMHAWEDLAERFSGSNDFTIFSIQQEIAMLMQDDKTIAQYYNKLVQLWGDEDALTEEISCDLGSRCKARRCSNDRKMRDRRMKFLMLSWIKHLRSAPRKLGFIRRFGAKAIDGRYSSDHLRLKFSESSAFLCDCGKA